MKLQVTGIETIELSDPHDYCQLNHHIVPPPAPLIPWPGTSQPGSAGGIWPGNGTVPPPVQPVPWGDISIDALPKPTKWYRNISTDKNKWTQGLTAIYEAKTGLTAIYEAKTGPLKG